MFHRKCVYPILTTTRFAIQHFRLLHIDSPYRDERISKWSIYIHFSPLPNPIPFYATKQAPLKYEIEFLFISRNACKNFWKKCLEHHSFFRTFSPLTGAAQERPCANGPATGGSSTYWDSRRTPDLQPAPRRSRRLVKRSASWSSSNGAAVDTAAAHGTNTDTSNAPGCQATTGHNNGRTSHSSSVFTSPSKRGGRSNNNNNSSSNINSRLRLVIDI